MNSFLNNLNILVQLLPNQQCQHLSKKTRGLNNETMG